MNIGLISHEVLETAQHITITGFSDIAHYLIANPVISIFVCLALGYLIGKLKIKSFTIGATVGTLLVGLLISLVFKGAGTYQIDGTVKTIFFSLFIFAIGYEVGPSFFASLKSSGLKIIILSLFFAVAAFVVSIVLFKAFGIGAGEAGGILAGSLTQSAILGTADSTMKGMLSGTELKTAESQMAIAYALTYVFGTVGVVVFLKNGAAKLIGVNLTDTVKKKIDQTNFHESSSENTVVGNIKARAFCIENGAEFIGKTIGSVEEQYGDDLTITQIIRKGKKVNLASDVQLLEGDTVTIIGLLDAVLHFEAPGMKETDDSEALKLDVIKQEIVLTNHFSLDVIKHLSENGIVISERKRDNNVLSEDQALKALDHLTLVGPKDLIAKVVKKLGYVKDTGTETDVSFISMGLVVGLLIGAISFVVSGIPITLGSGGGALIGGLLFGYYQDKHSNYGLMPKATRWFCKSVGLNLFIAIVGLTSGASFLSALQSMGVKVLLIGVLVTILPHIASVYFGRFVLKLDAVDIIGALCGAGTCTAALNGVVEEYESSIFAVAYTPGYAMGNILLTVLGPLVVAMCIH
ncbi:MAG: aspartate-alanine antiporter [Oribacterium parvum]|jgi:aspartate-alanine antiporter|uniref:aspartate-alanine antiporter n=1 Tax=Oribacterium parvum TaxID=1501329 RepID=UPI001CB05072|nr:aspartate-alanine antiporter [Oribacterium parvum]MBF1268647.1 aspartate-alanine antiporter [Oribacterium parvum]